MEIQSRKHAQQIIEALHGTLMEDSELKITVVEPEAPKAMPPSAAKRTITTNCDMAYAVKPKRPRIKSSV